MLRKRDLIMEKLLDLLNRTKPEVDFVNNKRLVDDGLLDSLDIVSIIMAIEKEYDIVINPDDIDPDNFQSAESVYDMINKELS